jgi:aspartyl-tRNA(Asn)/glutamyl-tRNA(Gln) amidotransferase subunit A
MDPYMLTVSEASRQIREGALTPVKLAESLLNRIEKLEPTIEAWVTIHSERVMEEAEKSTKEAEEGVYRSSLHGIPVGIKDIYYTAGMRTTMGSTIYSSFIPAYDAETVKRLKNAGAVILGKTETTEFAVHDPAPTRNPWNTAHTPGGSSSGSAAAVSSGMCPTALGSQTGGSVVRPASYCGVVGVKPTYDLLPRDGVFPLSWSLDHVGFFTRSVEDVALVLDVLSGIEKPVPVMNVPPRIGLLSGYFKENAVPEVWTGFEQTVGTLWGEGANFTDVSLPDSFKFVPDVHRVIMAVEAASVHEDSFRTQRDDYRDYLKGFIYSGLLVPASAYLRAQRIRRIILNDLLRLLNDYDCFICPASTDPAPEGLEWTGSPAFNAPWSLTGLPSMTLPMGFSDEKLPLGLQLIGRPYSEHMLFSIASWCESRLDFPRRPVDPIIK